MEDADERAVVILLAAGVGRRVGADEPKAFLTIGGRPILAVAAGAAAASPLVSGIVVTAPAGWEDRARGCVEGCGVPAEVVTGGATRQESVRAALAALPSDTQVVAVHFVMVAHPSLPAKNVKELIALAKARPGQINYSSSGPGGAPHLAAELLKSMTHVNLVHRVVGQLKGAYRLGQKAMPGGRAVQGGNDERHHRGRPAGRLL